jgi:hypothetical protein
VAVFFLWLWLSASEICKRLLPFLHHNPSLHNSAFPLLLLVRVQVSVRKGAVQLEERRQEVDIFIHTFLKQEGIEKNAAATV